MTERVYPLKQPKGWKPKMPRYTLKLPETVTELSVTYIGVQSNGNDAGHSGAKNNAHSAIITWLQDDSNKPLIVEQLEVVSGRDIPDTTIWMCYWTSVSSSQQALSRLNLAQIHKALGNNRTSIGLWRETFTPDLSHFETNYAGTDYRPGLSQVAGSEQISHERTGYWGAARDRIPASAYDRLGGDGTNGDDSKSNRADGPERMYERKLGAHYVGQNKNTIAHIRSGQWWENCTDEEAEAYETNLEPALREGLRDIAARPLESGDFGVRFLRNVQPDGTTHSGRPRRETCGAGVFRSLADMEEWAKNCPSHHKIYNGSMQHKAHFGEKAKFRTWHEVCVLRPGEASFEYLNCVDETGSLSFLELDERGVA